MELDLLTLKGSSVSSRGFGMSMGSICFWAVLLAFAVLDTSISTDTSKWPPQHIFTAASPLLVPGIIAGVSVPWYFPALLTEA